MNQGGSERDVDLFAIAPHQDLIAADDRIRSDQIANVAGDARTFGQQQVERLANQLVAAVLQQPAGNIVDGADRAVGL